MRLIDEVIELKLHECSQTDDAARSDDVLLGGPDSAQSVEDERTGSQRLDWRESLANDRVKGPVERVSLCLERITQLHGIMIDVDPKFLEPGNSLFPPADDPLQFFKNIDFVIDRHPLLKDAEVRSSGSGLHLLLWLDPPVELQSEGEQHHWDAIVKAVQASIPSDPNAPGITAMTRPIGSINSKNGAMVTMLQPGKPIAQQSVIAYVEQLSCAPFRGVAQVLLGSERVEPCPVCKAGGSRFTALDWVGKCYSCGQVDLERLFCLICRAHPEDHQAHMDRANGAQEDSSQDSYQSLNEPQGY